MYDYDFAELDGALRGGEHTLSRKTLDRARPDVAASGRKRPQFPGSTALATRVVEALLAVASLRGDRAPLHDPANVLIVEPFGLGDCVLVNGMVGALRRCWANSTVHVLCQARWEWLFQSCGNTQVHTITTPWATQGGGRPEAWLELFRMVSQLRRLRVDVGFDVRGDVRSQALLMAVGCRERIGHTSYSGSNITLRGSLLTRAPAYVHEHRGCQNLRLLREAGLEASQLEYHLPSVPSPTQHFSLTIHPGAGWQYKLWKPRRWAELLTLVSQRLPPPYQLLAHRSERGVLDEIVRDLKVPVAVTITDDLQGLACALLASRAYVGLDSGALHLAVALGVPVVGLYGPGIAELFYPLGGTVRTVSKQEAFPCAPCLQRQCHHPDFTCMDAISVDDVARALFDGDERPCELPSTR